MDARKAAWVAGILLVAGLAAAWGWAEWSLRDRVSGFAQDVHGIGVERGVDNIPGEERVAEQVRDIAAAHGLEVVELDVSVEDLSEDNMDRADLVTREADERIQKAFEGEAGRAGGSHRRPDFEMKGSLVEMRAVVIGDKWLWSIEDEVEVSKVLGRRMEMQK